MSLWSEVMFQVKYLECLPSVLGDVVVGSTNTPMAAVLRNSIRRLLDVIPYGGYWKSVSHHLKSPLKPKCYFWVLRRYRLLFLSARTDPLTLDTETLWLLIGQATQAARHVTLSPTDEETVDFARVVRWLYSREESKWGESWRRRAICNNKP